MLRVRDMVDVLLVGFFMDDLCLLVQCDVAEASLHDRIT
jgi:hypothetical protein